MSFAQRKCLQPEADVFDQVFPSGVGDKEGSVKLKRLEVFEMRAKGFDGFVSDATAIDQFQLFEAVAKLSNVGETVICHVWKDISGYQ